MWNVQTQVLQILRHLLDSHPPSVISWCQTRTPACMARSLAEGGISQPAIPAHKITPAAGMMEQVDQRALHRGSLPVGIRRGREECLCESSAPAVESCSLCT